MRNLSETLSEQQYLQRDCKRSVGVSTH